MATVWSAMSRNNVSRSTSTGTISSGLPIRPTGFAFFFITKKDAIPTFNRSRFPQLEWVFKPIRVEETIEVGKRDRIGGVGELGMPDKEDSIHSLLEQPARFPCRSDGPKNWT